jgi:hypothetical protein
MGAYAVLPWRSRLKISFCEIFGVVQFSTFATLSVAKRTFGQTVSINGRQVTQQRGRGWHGPGDAASVYLNFGIGGTLMRGGGMAVTLLAFPIPLGSVSMLFAALMAAALAPSCPVGAKPPPCANAAPGTARIMNSAAAIFRELFDMVMLLLHPDKR